MIVKHRGAPLGLFRIEALDRRLPNNHDHKERVQRDHRKIASGVRGEKEIDYPLQFLRDDRYLILHDLRLPDQNGYFQLDTLILCKRYILILEVKNWYGTILFEESGQVMRIGDDGVEEGFSNPTSQVKLQQHRLQKWLQTNGIPTLPLDFLIVISFPSTILKAAPSTKSIPEHIIHNNQLLFNLLELEQTDQPPIVNMKEIKALSKQLIKAHTPLTENILDKYQVKREDLIKGVFCPECSAVPMQRGDRKWHCTICGCISTHAHLETFNDYKMLINNRLSNREAREFLQLNSAYVVKRLLISAGYQHDGKTSARLYKLELMDK